MGSKYNALSRHLFLRFRRRRMKQFFALLAPALADRVVDIGGSVHTWGSESETHAPFSVTLVNNLQYEDLAGERFQSIEADATALPFSDNAFDIAFSNSVIEHLGTWEKQQAFAREARRVAPKLWIQTPARSFPIEAHLLAPYIQYLPKSLQHRIVRWTPRGLLNPGVVHGIVDEVRLLTYREVARLFPDCRILRERFFGLTKSYIAVRVQGPDRKSGSGPRKGVQPFPTDSAAFHRVMALCSRRPVGML
jgi:Methyltransferase domain